MPAPYALGFTSQPEEIRAHDLPVQGKLPDWLQGTLVRNGPGQFEASAANPYHHWFDGLAMLHSFTFAQGKVSYANRYLRTNAYQQDHADGKIHFRRFATDPCRSFFKRVFSLFFPEEVSQNTSITVNRIAHQFLALTENVIAVEFDPRTLDTLGVIGYQDGLKGQLTSAHMHYDPVQEMGINYMFSLGIRNRYVLYTQTQAGRKQLTSFPVEHPSYMHSFGLSEHYIILAEFSFVLPSAIAVVMSGKPFIYNYEWQPQRPTRFVIVDRATGAVVSRVETEAFFAFHHINAYEAGDHLLVDVACYPDARLVRQAELNHLRDEQGYINSGEFRRYRVPLKGGRATYERIGQELLELPVIHYRDYNTKPYRYAYGVGVRRGTQDFLNQLVKFDTMTGDTLTWHEAGCYPSEPVFAPAPQATREDEGVLLSVVLDTQAGRSFLLVQDAITFAEVARVPAPHWIPFSFHGQFWDDV